MGLLVDLEEKRGEIGAFRERAEETGGIQRTLSRKAPSRQLATQTQTTKQLLQAENITDYIIRWPSATRFAVC